MQGGGGAMAKQVDGGKGRHLSFFPRGQYIIDRTESKAEEGGVTILFTPPPPPQSRG